MCSFTQREAQGRKMDALTHMLTDPLDPKEEDDGQITEECMLGNCRLNLPEDLLEDVSEPTWYPVIICCPFMFKFTRFHLLLCFGCNAGVIYIFPLSFVLQQPEIFFSVMSERTWSEVLSDSQRQHLRQFLPQFPDNSVAEQNSTLADLFNNRNFNFGNPLHLAQKLFRGAP